MLEVAWLPSAQQRIMGISLLLRFREHKEEGCGSGKNVRVQERGGVLPSIPLLCVHCNAILE